MPGVARIWVDTRKNEFVCIHVQSIVSNIRLITAARLHPVIQSRDPQRSESCGLRSGLLASLFLNRILFILLILILDVALMRIFPGFLFSLRVGLLLWRRRADRRRRSHQRLSRLRLLLGSIRTLIRSRRRCLWPPFYYRRRLNLSRRCLLGYRLIRGPVRARDLRWLEVIWRRWWSLVYHHRAAHRPFLRTRCVAVAGAIYAGPLRGYLNSSSNRR